MKNCKTISTKKQQKYQHYHQVKLWYEYEYERYVYLTGKEMLPAGQRGVIEQAKFTYSPLAKALEKQTKAIEGQGEKQIKAIKDHEKQLVISNALTYILR